MSQLLMKEFGEKIKAVHMDKNETPTLINTLTSKHYHSETLCSRIKKKKPVDRNKILCEYADKSEKVWTFYKARRNAKQLQDNARSAHERVEDDVRRLSEVDQNQRSRKNLVTEADAVDLMILLGDGLGLAIGQQELVLSQVFHAALPAAQLSLSLSHEEAEVDSDDENSPTDFDMESSIVHEDQLRTQTQSQTLSMGSQQQRNHIRKLDSFLANVLAMKKSILLSASMLVDSAKTRKVGYSDNLENLFETITQLSPKDGIAKLVSCFEILSNVENVGTSNVILSYGIFGILYLREAISLYESKFWNRVDRLSRANVVCGVLDPENVAWNPTSSTLRQFLIDLNQRLGMTDKRGFIKCALQICTLLAELGLGVSFCTGGEKFPFTSFRDSTKSTILTLLRQKSLSSKDAVRIWLANEYNNVINKHLACVFRLAEADEPKLFSLIREVVNKKIL